MRSKRKQILIGGLLSLVFILSLSLLLFTMISKPQWHTSTTTRRSDTLFPETQTFHPAWRRSASLTDHRFTYHLNHSIFKEEFPSLQFYNCKVLAQEAGFCWSPGGKPLLVMAVKTHPLSSVRRAALRRTWAVERAVLGYHVKALFLMATTTDTNSTRPMQLVAEEIKEYHDILLWDFTESHHNLSLKERCFIEWVHHNCKEADFIFKGDDDEFVNIEAVVRYVKETPDASNAIHGSIQNESVVMHTGKYRVSESLFPYPLYPFFVSGGGFIIPGAFIPALYQASTWLPVFPLDDVYFGFLALAANLSFRHDERFDTLGTWVGLCSYKRALVVHGVSPEGLVNVWQSLQGWVPCPEGILWIYILLLPVGTASLFFVIIKYCKFSPRCFRKWVLVSEIASWTRLHSRE